VRLLLDTHIWLWLLLAPERLSADAELAITDRESEVHLSPISAWETLVLARKGRLTLTPSPSEWVLDALRRSTPTAAPLTHSIALRSETLGGFESQDPADRFLVATALEHDLTLVSADAAMLGYGQLRTIW
jgi:PIN domain nuclease of toxin-antitoxin system